MFDVSSAIPQILKSTGIEIVWEPYYLEKLDMSLLQAHKAVHICDRQGNINVQFKDQVANP